MAFWLECRKIVGCFLCFHITFITVNLIITNSLWTKRFFQVPYFVRWESEGRYRCSMVFRWEPEGRYLHQLCTEIMPFWFSTEHRWTALMPFWLSTEDLANKTGSSIQPMGMRDLHHVFMHYLQCSSHMGLSREELACHNILNTKHIQQPFLQ